MNDDFSTGDIIEEIFNGLTPEQRKRVEGSLPRPLHKMDPREVQDRIKAYLEAGEEKLVLPEEEQDLFLVQLAQRMDQEQERARGWQFLRRLAAGGAFLLLLFLLARRPGGDGPRPQARPAAGQNTITITRLASSHTPAVYPDFSGLLQQKSRLEGAFGRLSPGPMPVFPETPQLTTDIKFQFPRIQL